MSKKNIQQQLPDRLKKGGTFSCYSMDGIVTIEGISTSFNMEELKLLSYASDLRSSNLNLDLLMQRDLDETRACEMGKYLLPTVTDENKIVFLPPLIAAIVITDEKGDLVDYYPRREDSSKRDADDVVSLRKWGNNLTVKNYLPLKGAHTAKIKHSSDTPAANADTRLAEIEMNCLKTGKSRSSGIRLVVIDGQHRLCALLDQDQKGLERMRNWLIPVMLVYPPDATENSENSDRYSMRILEIFRQLFVDVNGNFVNVSGHFLILLSDKTLGSMICRSFCQKIINDASKNTSKNTSKNNLAMIEWNTQSNKDSKTIIKEYSITSIGVLYEALESIFKEEKKMNSLRYIMDIDDKFFRGRNEKLQLPELFPWEEFTLKDKSTLKESIDKTFTPCLIQIFFHSECYREIKKSFDHAFAKISNNCKNDPEDINALRKNLKYGESPPLKTAFKSEFRKIKAEFIKAFNDKYNAKKPSIDIIRRKIFQKGMISAWIEMLDIAQEDHQLNALDITKEFVKLLDHAINIELFVNDTDHSYLQQSVFRNAIIITINYGKTQISRLILACLKDINHNNPLDLKFNPIEKEKLAKLGKKAKIDFLENLKKERKKVFKKNYKTNVDVGITSEEREKLKELERLAKSKNENQQKNQRDFKAAIEKHITPKYEEACQQLNEILG